MPRRRIPESVKALRRRLRRLRGDDLTRLATAAGVARSTAYAIWSGTTRIPEPATLETITTALDVLHPTRLTAETKLPEVKSTMTQQFLLSAEMAEVYAAPVFELCDLYAHESARCGVDLDRQASDAVFAIGRGEPLSVVLGFIKDEDRFGEKEMHPAADKVRAALRDLYARTFGGTGPVLSA